ncbi:hypothetical protein GGR50DRAFT_701334 [Xylaria sp. CBS 124048]|nr:hypothetical protein GGR50DRAFT_701334 [Xylaria sp. CBS 124048]
MTQSVNKFPNGMFPYGAPIHITPEDHAARVAEAPEPRVPYGIAVWATTSNTKRSLHEANRLGVDETVLYHDEDTVTPSEHWATVLELIPVQPWVDAGRVVVYLATTQPLEKPANTRLWRLARKWLHECVERGSKSGWGENSDFPDELQDESFWEALRIIGDTDAGYGTFPDTLKEKMDAVGVTWILVNPRDRWIPVCWKTWADRAGMDYAAALDIMTMPSTQVTHTDKASTMPATPTRAAARATSAVTPSTATMTGTAMTPSKIALIKFTPRKRKRVTVDESQTADIGSLTPSTPRTTFIIK